VQLLRSVLLKHPVLALLIGLAALALRLAVPAGFMPALDHGQVVLAPCPGAGPAAHHDEGGAQVESSCAFADLSLPAMGGPGAFELAAALLFFAFTLLFLRSAPPRGAALRLRPPLRGPPLHR
jgi:hypothetical protein